MTTRIPTRASSSAITTLGAQGLSRNQNIGGILSNSVILFPASKFPGTVVSFEFQPRRVAATSIRPGRLYVAGLLLPILRGEFRAPQFSGLCGRSAPTVGETFICLLQS